MSLTARQTLADRARSQPLFFWIVLLLGAVMLGQYLSAGVVTWRYSTDSKSYGWGFERRGGSWSATPGW
jgi:hypothetical protein